MILAASQSEGLSGGWTVELQIGDPADTGMTALWDTGLWDVNLWGSSEDTAYLVDVTSRVKALKTGRGRRRFTARFKTGKASFVLDNHDGVFTPQSGAPAPGLLDLRPGRAVRIKHREAGVFFGFVDTKTDVYSVDGDVNMRIVAYDAFANFQRNNRPAVPEVGSGDGLRARQQRIIDRFQPGAELKIAGEGSGVVFQATTLAQDMLSLLQITSDSVGGGCWMDVAGDVVSSQRDYFTNLAAAPPTWNVGGVSGVEVAGAVTERTMQRIITEAHMSRAGGDEQVATNPTAQALYGRRTHTRLDLVNADDDDVGFLAQRLVDFAGQDRLRVSELVFKPEPDTATETFCEVVNFGTVIRCTIDTMFGWSWTAPTQVFAIEHDVTPQEWICTLLVDDSEFTLTGFGFDQSAFDQGFS